jgi:hypothetical protein
MVGDGYNDYRTKEVGIVDQFIAYCEHVKRANVIALADSVAHNFNEVVDLYYQFQESAALGGHAELLKGFTSYS